MGLDINPLKLRLIRVELNAGKVETLITSLLDTTEFPSDLFGDLYHLRWPVEEDYKVIKNRITVENFSGKSVLSVYQDFHAKVFSKNIAAVITNTIKPAVEDRYSNLKYGYQVNFVRALSKLKSTIGYCQLFCVKLISAILLINGKLPATFPMGFDLQLSSIFKQTNASRV
jgi:hypothetical protein